MSPIAIPPHSSVSTQSQSTDYPSTDAGPSTPSRAAHSHLTASLTRHKHTHFLDLSETDGVHTPEGAKTPRPVTLTPSPPVRSVGLPISVDEAVNGSHDYFQGQKVDRGAIGVDSPHHDPQSAGDGNEAQRHRQTEQEGKERAVKRTKSTRSVLGRGRGRVEPGTSEEGEAARLLRTIDFAARKHTCQRRKDLDQTPYINHPIAVANFLSSTGITDVRVMQAAILHDTVEDTHTTIEEIADHFGPDVARIVEECTDDQNLSGQARKAAQIATAGSKSSAAQQVKLADKLHNLESIRRCPPVGWTARRVQHYFIWAKQVTDICAPSHPPLAERLQRLYETAYTEIDGKYFPCHPDCCGPLTEEEKSRIDQRLQCLKKGEQPRPLPIFF